MIPAHTFLGLRADQITPEVEEEFFTSLRMRNGTYKTTFRRRFSEVDRAIGKHVQDGAMRVDNIFDIGISSGVSTLELYETLNATGHQTRIVATDLMTEAYLVRVFPGCFALLDDTGYPLRHDIFDWTMKPWVIAADYRNGFFVLRKGVNLAFGRRAVGLMLRRSASAAVRKVGLVTPRLRRCEGVVVQQDDVTRYNSVFANRFEFVRAANILNKGYFAEGELKSAIGNVGRYLAKPGGALLVVRTHDDGTNHGTLFVVGGGDGEIRVLQRFGEGSEIEGLVLACLRTRDSPDSSAQS